MGLIIITTQIPTMSAEDDKGILEQAADWIAETAQAAGEYLGATSKEAEHKAKQEGHKAERKVDTEIAKNENAPLGDRVKGAGNAVVDGAQELVEGGKKEYQEQKAENAKNKMTGDAHV